MNNNQKLQCLIENKLLTDDKVPKTGRLLRNKIFVIGFPPNCTEMDLERFFSNFGPVRETRIIKNENGITRGFAFITFVKERSVVNALEYRGPLYFMDRKLSINPAIKKQYSFLPSDKSSPSTITETSVDSSPPTSTMTNQMHHPHNLLSNVNQGTRLMPMTSQTYGYYYETMFPSFSPSMFCSFWQPYYPTTNPYIPTYPSGPLMNGTEFCEIPFDMTNYGFHTTKRI